MVGRIAQRLGLVSVQCGTGTSESRAAAALPATCELPAQKDLGSFETGQRSTQPMLAPLLGSNAVGGMAPVQLDPAAPPPRVARVLDGAESKTVARTLGRSSEGAVFSDRGIGYAPYNEDAAILGTVQGEPFAVIADQAGGEGHLEDHVGFASALAARSVEQAAAEIAAGAAPWQALEAAVSRAHLQIREVNDAAGINAVTTVTGAVVRGSKVHVVNVGDSQVLHFSARGELKHATRAHSLGEENYENHPDDPMAATRDAHVITRSVGAWRPDVADIHEWEVLPGDSLVLLSDGLLDANLKGQVRAHAARADWKHPHSEVTRRQIAELVAGARSSPEAVKALVEYARRQVLEGNGKPDNLSAAVIRLWEPLPPLSE